MASCTQPQGLLKLGMVAHEGHSIPSLGQMMVCPGPGEAGQVLEGDCDRQEGALGLGKSGEGGGVLLE